MRKEEKENDKESRAWPKIGSPCRLTASHSLSLPFFASSARTTSRRPRSGPRQSQNHKRAKCKCQREKEKGIEGDREKRGGGKASIEPCVRSRTHLPTLPSLLSARPSPRGCFFSTILPSVPPSASWSIPISLISRSRTNSRCIKL